MSQISERESELTCLSSPSSSPKAKKVVTFGLFTEVTVDAETSKLTVKDNLVAHKELTFSESEDSE